MFNDSALIYSILRDLFFIYFFITFSPFDSFESIPSCFTRAVVCIRLFEKFLSFYEEIIDAQRILFYIILSNYVRSILLC